MKGKKWILKAITFLLAVALILIGASAAKLHGKRSCIGISIKVEYGDAQPLLTRQMIIDIIGNVYDSLPGRPLRSIDTGWLRDQLLQIPFVSAAAVSVEPSGHVNIHVRQRTPMVRVISGGVRSIYLSDDGMIMPAYPDMGAALPVITLRYVGESSSRSLNGILIDSLPEGHVLGNVYRFARELAARPFMYDLVEQADIDDAGRIVLVPMIGPERIYFGSFSDAAIKLRNTELFYKKTSGRIDWGRYEAIDARFINQIVCIKAK